TLISQAEKSMVRQRVVDADQSKPWRAFRRVADMSIRRGPRDAGFPRFAQNLHGNGPEVLVDQFFFEQFTIKRRAAFAKQRSDAVFSSKQFHNRRNVGASAFADATDLNRLPTSQTLYPCPHLPFS